VEIAERLLNEAGVAALPGTAFGRYGEGYMGSHSQTLSTTSSPPLKESGICDNSLELHSNLRGNLSRG